MFNNNIIDYFNKNITQNPTIFTISKHNFKFCSYDTWNEPNTLNYIIKDYENFYKKTFNYNNNYPLYNTYVIPNETYEKIMKWVIQLYDKIYPWCVQKPNASHFTHIAGIYERIMGYCIGQENLQNIALNILHDHRLKEKSY
jgi:hypothetical protein